jgi:hypothetical protein
MVSLSQRRLVVFVGTAWWISTAAAFLPTRQQQQQHAPRRIITESSSTLLFAEDADKEKAKKNYKTKPLRKFTIAELREEMVKRPAAYEAASQTQNGQKKYATKSRRTRARVDAPKQEYLYSAQRVKLEKEGKAIPKKKKSLEEGENYDKEQEDEQASTAAANKSVDEFNPIVQARLLGLVNAAQQHCDALVDEVEPRIVGKIRVSEETGSGAFAYIVDKPPGWSILGGGGGGSTNKKPKVEATETPAPREKVIRQPKPKLRRVKFQDGDGTIETLEFSDDAVLALMTPDERADFEKEGGFLFQSSGPVVADDSIDDFGFDDITLMTPEERAEAGIDLEDWDPEDTPEERKSLNVLSGHGDVASMTPAERAEAGIVAGVDWDPNEIIEFDEADVLAMMTPEEREELGLDVPAKKNKPVSKESKQVPREQLDPVTLNNLKRIEARVAENKKDASFAAQSRSSVVSWLKEFKASEGTPIRGGNFWTAFAGATNVDDSGLVLLCPKASVDNVFVDFAEYIGVVGNGKFLAKKEASSIPKEFVQLNLLSKVKKGRGEDAAQTVRFTIPEHASTCSSIVSHAQAQFEDGIRGDPAANPFERRASRRLIHCNVLSVSSLLFDENVQAESKSLPDDIRILSDRLNSHDFTNGSFLGRASLRDNPLTTAYR